MVPTCRVQPLSAHTQSHFSLTHNSTALPGLAGPGEAGTCCLGPHSSFLFPWSIPRSRDTPGMGMAAPCRGSMFLGLDSREYPGAVWFLSEHGSALPLFFYKGKARFLQGDSCRALTATWAPVSHIWLLSCPAGCAEFGGLSAPHAKPEQGQSRLIPNPKGRG